MLLRTLPVSRISIMLGLLAGMVGLAFKLLVLNDVSRLFALIATGDNLLLANLVTLLVLMTLLDPVIEDQRWAMFATVPAQLLLLLTTLPSFLQFFPNPGDLLRWIPEATLLFVAVGTGGFAIAASREFLGRTRPVPFRTEQGDWTTQAAALGACLFTWFGMMILAAAVASTQPR